MKRRDGEFELIERFTRAFTVLARQVTLGIGDDCALLRVPPGRELAVTTDAVVDGVHFSSAFTAADIGHKALAVNLSDLAAMGATPLGFVCGIELPAERVGDLAEIARGMAGLAREHGIPLVGGNLTRAKTLAVTLTAMGAVDPRRVLKRSGAKAGDVILVSGELGGAARGLRTRASAACTRRQRRPNPQLALGAQAARWASAGIDVSDGLTQDLAHLLRASNLSAELDPKRVPVQAGATLDDALAGGEDYELVLTAATRDVPRILDDARRLGVALTVIGRCIAGGSGQVRLTGTSARGLPPGHDHFARKRRATKGSQLI